MADQLPPAGWYHDDTSTLRYWDGDQWTEHTREQQAEAVASDTDKAHRPWYAKKRFIIPGAVIVGIFALAAVGATMEDVPVEPDTPEATSEQAAEPAPEPETEPEPAPEPEPEEPEPAPEPEPAEEEAADGPDESAYIVVLDDQYGLEYMRFGDDRDRMIEFGYEACDSIESMGTITEDSLMASAGDMMRSQNVTIDDAIGIHSVAMTTLCPAEGERFHP